VAKGFAELAAEHPFRIETFRHVEHLIRVPQAR
jgi:hypothetical protein